MGPPRNINISPSVGPFRFLGNTIRRWLWAHSRISSSLFWSAHLGLSTLIFGDGYGPTQDNRHLPFSGPIQVSRQQYLAMAVGPFKNIDIFVLVGPLRIIDINIWQWLWPMGPPRNIDISPLVGPFRFIGDIIRRWLWAHPGLLTSLFQ
jgi:hypothetical protein